MPLKLPLSPMIEHLVGWHLRNQPSKFWLEWYSLGITICGAGQLMNVINVIPIFPSTRSISSSNLVRCLLAPPISRPSNFSRTSMEPHSYRWREQYAMHIMHIMHAVNTLSVFFQCFFFNPSMPMSMHYFRLKSLRKKINTPFSNSPLPPSLYLQFQKPLPIPEWESA